MDKLGLGILMGCLGERRDKAYHYNHQWGNLISLQYSMYTCYLMVKASYIPLHQAAVTGRSTL